MLDINDLNYYANGMDITYPGPVVLTDWKSISASLEKVISDLALLTVQFTSMNNRISILESAIAIPNPPTGPS